MRSRTAPAPLAEQARIAHGANVCGRCGKQIVDGDRECRLPDGSWCHIWPCLIPGRAA
jgi:hypothetical protein